jgi:hypothetical protein
MARLHGLYGPERTVEGNRAKCGGIDKSCVKEAPYSAPQGPKHQMNAGVGLRGGTNYGPSGTQGKHSWAQDTGGHAGLGGGQSRTGGAQGRH